MSHEPNNFLPHHHHNRKRLQATDCHFLSALRRTTKIKVPFSDSLDNYCIAAIQTQLIKSSGSILGILLSSTSCN